jgi:hypothetical protein
MTNLTCSNLGCKFNGEENVCQKDEVNLCVLCDGQTYLKCSQYEEREDKEWVNLKRAVENFFK